MSGEHGPERDHNGTPSTLLSPSMGNGYPGFKGSSLDNTTYLLM